MPVPRSGQVLVRNLYLSVDPYMRGRMAAPVESYAPPYPLGAPPGGSTVARVMESMDPDLVAGDLVVVNDGGWQDFVAAEGRQLRRLPQDMAQPSLALVRWA